MNIDESEPAPQPGTPACPVPLSALPSNFQRHVDPSSPLPLRMMGARGLVPMGPVEMTTALFMLSFDPDAGVRENARRIAAGLPDLILAMALRNETLDAPVLDHFASLLAGKEQYLEMLLLNIATPDDTVQRLAAGASERLVEIVAVNQLRLLRCPDIVRALVNNPAARVSTLDNVCDFCVRSGLALEDQPAWRAARRRVHGGAALDDELAQKVSGAQAHEQAEAEAELERMGAAGSDGAEQKSDLEILTEAQGKKRLSIGQQIMRLGVAKKVEWANKKGNREVRTLLLRDPNKLVQMAVIHSPRITLGEISNVAQSRTARGDVLQFIYDNRQLMKNYQIKLNIIGNPKVPVGVSMRFLSSLRMAEVKGLAKNRNIPHGLATAAKNLLEKKTGSNS